MRDKISDLVTGTSAAIVVFAAVPTVLIDLVGLPIPHHWDWAGLWCARGLFDLLAIMAWVAWAACCGPLLRSVVRRVRLHDTTVAGTGHLTEWLAIRIAGAILVLSPIPVAATTAAGASGRRPPAVVRTITIGPVRAEVSADAPATTPSSITAPAPGAADPSPAPDTVPTQYTVVAGDSLWSIAEHFYDDGGEWSTIAQANLGQIMDDGSRFVDPSLIRPGWILTLPTVAEAESSPGDDSASATTATVTTTATATALPALTPATEVAPTAEVPQTSTTLGARLERTPRKPARRHPPPSVPPGRFPLPELAALGTGVVLAAALARRARRARHLASLTRPEGGVSPEPSEPAAGTAADLVPFEGAPILEWLETANRHLRAALDEIGRARDSPSVQLVRVGPDGVEARLREPVSWAPPGWTLESGSAWRLSSALDLRAVGGTAQRCEPWLPVLLPVGDNEEGTWLVPVEPGACLPVFGAEADALVAAMRTAAESWVWSEHIVVTDDVLIAEAESAIVDRLEDGQGRPRVLFVGDPARLSGAARVRCAVLTTLPVPATDLTVTVDARGASLHPLGVIVRPALLDDARQAAVAEVLSVGRPAAPPRATAEPRPVTRRVPASPARSQPGGRTHPSMPRPDEPGPPGSTSLRRGPVEIRLLTAIPRIDGLETEIPPKRARRAVELVAYLALHHPDPVTSDRLRTRVLGSADADAAAKTLFNTAGAARRAMGRDTAGEPFLPPATKSSHYRISSLVTNDVTRAMALVAAADGAEEPDHTMALLREALSLVEGEPLAGALSGYAWWQAEGHERRLAGSLVDAACRLAPLATAAGYVDLAQWAVEQARLVEPYSEALSRVAMQVAADAGDADRLRREWQECRQRVDELDPGALPTEATERLYAELRRWVPAVTGAAVLAGAVESDD